MPCFDIIWTDEILAHLEEHGVSLRRAIHQSGRPLKKIAAEVGLDVFLLCDFLEGKATLRSDVLDRLAQAVGATIHLEPTLPPRAGITGQPPDATRSESSLIGIIPCLRLMNKVW